MTPSATACRARSSLVQWVRCNPRATGSRQASCTTRARWRGGKPLRASRAVRFPQHRIQPAPLVAATDAPDRGRVALHPEGHDPDALPRGDAQQDARVLHLGPRQRTAPGDGLEERDIVGIQRQRARLATTHGQPPTAPGALPLTVAVAREFLALLRARATRSCLVNPTPTGGR